MHKEPTTSLKYREDDWNRTCRCQALLAEGGKLRIKELMDGQPAPKAVLDLLACNCPRKCELPKCVCMVNGLTFTNMCRLLDYENQAPTSENEISSDKDKNELKNHSDN